VLTVNDRSNEVSPTQEGAGVVVDGEDFCIVAL
jgi:hypothetical protein